jgi:hypothetical protein
MCLDLEEPLPYHDTGDDRSWNEATGVVVDEGLVLLTVVARQFGSASPLQ